MKLRCFIAINLPENIKEELAQILSDLKKKNSGWQIKYVKPEGIHLTLHFLGYLDETQIQVVKDILKEITQSYFNFNLNINQFGGFPNLNSPRVLFVAGRGEIELAKKLQQELGENLARAGFEVEKRPWQVHFTLARIKGPGRLNLENIKVPELDFKVEGVELMKSQLTPSGAKYKVIESFKLK